MILFSVSVFQLSPAAHAIVGSNLLEHDGECPCVDLFALVDGHCSSCFVVVPARDDAFGIRDYAPVV
jgi:hypothetical protein